MSEQTKIPLLDRTIERVAPQWAARREAARLMLDTTRSYRATYRGGVSTRLSGAWGRVRSFVGGSARDRYLQASMRDRAREVYRNNPIGHSLVNTETDNIIADGFTLQARTGSDEFNKEAEERWYAWIERADVRGLMTGTQLQRLSWQSPRIDGDGGFILVSDASGSRLQYIPGDLICNPDSKANSPTLFDGVEVGKTGNPIAFHVLDQNEFGKRQWARIDARDFIYLPHLTDPLDVRGSSCFTQIFTLLNQLDEYVDAVTIAARMGAIFGLIFKDGKPGANYASLPTLLNSQGNDQKAVTLENGMVRYVGPEGSVAQVTPQQPMSQTPDFIRAIFRLICLPFDMPLEIGQKDLSQVNFSGGRIGLLGYYRACRAKQDWIKLRCWDRIYRWWLDREVKMGRFVSAVPGGQGMDGRPAFETHEFLGREWDYTDPVSEAQADLLEIDMGIKSPQQAAASRGRDWEDVQRQQAQAKAVRDQAELPTNTRSSLTRDGTDPESKPV